ncbi:hypothetical protein R50076_23030 [Gilvimarinus japonicus]
MRESAELTHMQGELQDYLLQRFGSVRLARWATRETLRRLSGSPILETVGNPYLYAVGYALSLALKFDAEPPSATVSAAAPVLVP